MYNKALVLKQRPDETFPQNMDFFEVREVPVPELNDGEILIRVLYIGVDPVMRVWLSGAKTYIDAVQIGQVMPAFGVGIIVETKQPKWDVGQIVFGVLECANLCKRPTKPLFKVPLFELGDPNIPLLLSIYGVTGLTALNGMKLIPQDHIPTSERQKTFCVSSAAGSTGSIALQIAKHMGFKTIGIVSGREKKDFVLSLGADECITYNDCKENDEIIVDKLTQEIKRVAPNGIDVYFDNAGEEVLDAVLPGMAKEGLILLCGATSTYNAWKNRGGLTNLASAITQQVKLEGIIFYQDQAKIYSGFSDMIELVNDGIIKHQEEIYYGVENFVQGLKRVFLGQNMGKIIIQIEQQVEHQAKL
ncbi:unnamed protein product [Paramecium pentaurelia]|uniref:Enoyl reductase (ER) domain-containing protein n=1 Tax=Paramecium pentaurelia TaxID=43138 RepID=A0A8S1XIL2_9CILI|nr:unnamed protein product [Paramecium pentaurelia]